MFRKFTKWLGDKLSYWLSTMAMFYAVSLLILIPLAFVRPTGTIAWIQYSVTVFFQGAALPLLGYVARIAGEKTDTMLKETHDTVMEELALVKEELILAKEERDSLNRLVLELHSKLDTCNGL
ncbi:MAG TPA: hypothetical protein VFF14_12310 [Candidatus Deferrimicrobium sp.]|nr:hypothetical protein [Candidatus Deferrimicrobium sp.]